MARLLPPALKIFIDQMHVIPVKAANDVQREDAHAGDHFPVGTFE